VQKNQSTQYETDDQFADVVRALHLFDPCEAHLVHHDAYLTYKPYVSRVGLPPH